MSTLRRLLKRERSGMKKLLLLSVFFVGSLGFLVHAVEADITKSVEEAATDKKPTTTTQTGVQPPQSTIKPRAATSASDIRIEPTRDQPIVQEPARGGYVVVPLADLSTLRNNLLEMIQSLSDSAQPIFAGLYKDPLFQPFGDSLVNAAKQRYAGTLASDIVVALQRVNDPLYRELANVASSKDAATLISAANETQQQVRNALIARMGNPPRAAQILALADKEYAVLVDTQAQLRNQYAPLIETSLKNIRSQLISTYPKEAAQLTKLVIPNLIPLQSLRVEMASLVTRMSLAGEYEEILAGKTDVTSKVLQASKVGKDIQNMQALSNQYYKLNKQYKTLLK